MTGLVFGSICSGIEAASVAWEPLGWRAAFLSEIDAFPRAVLQHRFPTTPLHGDFTTIKAGQYDSIDVLCGGTPCQSFSIAGLRGGLDDDRGNLALEFLKLARRLGPRWVVWENVPGALSSNEGRDFGAIIGGLAECGYGYAWRVLDAQYFGVPQRRQRVFLVGHLGNWRAACAVLFERESLSGNPAPRRVSGAEYTNCLTARAGASGADLADAEAGTLIAAQAFKAAHFTRGKDGAPAEIAPPLTADADKGDQDTLIRAFSAKDHGADAGRLAPTLRAMANDGSHANGGGQVAVAFQTRIARNGRGQPTGIVPALNGADAGATSDMRPCIATEHAVRRLTPRECERLQGFPDDHTEAEKRHLASQWPHRRLNIVS